MRKIKEEFRKYRNRKIIDTKHSIKQFLERYPEEDRDTIDWCIDNAIDYILDINKDEYGIYVFHSVSTGIGFVINWRKDFQNRFDKKNHAILITILEIAETHYAKEPTDKYREIEQQLFKWAKEKILKEEKRKVKFEKNTYDHADEDNFFVNIWEGEYWDVNAKIRFIK